MNMTHLGTSYRVTTEQELLHLLSALGTLHVLACGKRQSGHNTTEVLC